MNKRIITAAISSAALLALVGCTASGVVTVPVAGANGNATTQPTTTAPVSGSKQATTVRVAPDNLVVTVGAAKDITANVTYADGTIDSAITWSSSDDTVATVNPTTGKLSGVKPGVTTLVAASVHDPSKKGLVTVTVRSAEVVDALAKIDPSEAKIKVGGTVRLNAQIQMSDGTNSPNVTWKSDNESIAVVSNGLVTGIAAGETTIWAVAAGDSTKKASAKITVEAAK